MTKLILSSAFLIFCIACQTNKTQAVDTIKKSLLDKTFSHHGGLTAWQKYQSLSYKMTSVRDTIRNEEKTIINLYNRHERIEYKNAVIGNNGVEYWKQMKDSTAEDINSKFYANLQFYFFAMPFVLGDPGVNLTQLEDRSLEGKAYQVIKATFGDGVGVAPKDQYILYLDKLTNQLEAMLYSVTYFNEENSEKYGALLYSDWQTVDGMLLPARIDRRGWDSEKMELTVNRGAKIIEEVKLSTIPPDPQIFAPPS